MESFFSILIQDQSSVLVARIVLAAFLGALIGFERDIHGRSAGLRTHLLVSMGAATFTVISILITSEGGNGPSDPGRIAAQIVTGIGFLGAGVIIKEGVNVRGLTTSACLWIAAAVGMASGAGYYSLSVITTLFALFGLVVLKQFEKWYKKDSYRTLTITTPISIEPSVIIQVVKSAGVSVINCDIRKDYEGAITITKLMVKIFHKDLTDKMAHGIIEALESSKIHLKDLRWNRY